MKLTKAQRHEYYKKALDTFSRPRAFIVGICSTLAMMIPNKEVTGKNISKLFPELLKRKPKDKDVDEVWWHLDDIKSRQEVLKQCILETTPKKSKKRK